MENIVENIEKIKAELPEGVKLVAVSKFHPAEVVRAAYDAGLRTFGENRAQELAAKQPLLPADIEWHFIGHLQKNKVKTVVGRAAMIQSVDSLELLALIDKESAKLGLKTDVLLQIHVAQEEAKSGFYIDELNELCEKDAFAAFANVNYCGVMTMATNTRDDSQVAREFGSVKQEFDLLRKNYFSDKSAFAQLSMGMSHDWKIAVSQGATMVRVGTAIFGQREY